MHHQAARSIFWECGADICDVGDPAFEKEAWLSSTLLAFGDCGFTIGEEATVLFCSRDDAPGAQKLPSGPVSPDAAIITSLFIKPARADRGLEPVLLDAAIMNLSEREFPAVEAFGYYSDPDAVAQLIGAKPDAVGLMSVEHLEGAGLEVIEDHPYTPRLRLELPPTHDLLSAAAVEDLLARAFA